MIDALLVAAFVLYAVAVALRSRREASRDLTQYFLAGRSLSAWESGLSMTATQYAADTPLLAAGLVATGGVFALWRLWIYGIAFLLLGFLLGAAWWRAGVVTDAELCELRYGGRAALWLRVVKAFYYGGVFNCAVLAMVMVAAVRIAEPFLLWPVWLPAWLFDPMVRAVEWVGVALVASPGEAAVWERSASNLLSLLSIYAFTVLYSATGGLRSVVRTDLGQLALLLTGTALYAGIAWDAVGGADGLSAALAENLGSERASSLRSFEPWDAGELGAVFFAVLGLQWLVQMNADGTGYLAQRCMACRSEVDARRAPVIFAFAQVGLRSLLWLPILLALLVLIPLEPGQGAAERELAFVEGIQTLLPPGARGLMLVGMLAALASTLDTHLNWGASYLTNDLYARVLCRAWLGRRPGARELVWVARLSAPLIMGVSLLVMLRLDSIQTAWHMTLLLGGGLGIPLVLRWLWWRANAWGELAAIVASGIAAPLLLATVESEPLRLLAIAAVGALAAVSASLATAPESAAKIAAFDERVRPPGFWPEPSARARLLRGLLATGAASGTLFCSLVGLGSLLIDAPAPFGFAPGLWIAANLLTAAAFTPLWWRELRAAD